VFAWAALVPLLLALMPPFGRAATPMWRGFLLGLTTGTAYFAGTIYWTADVMRTYGDVNRILSIGVAGLLVAYLALFPALFGALMALILRAGTWTLLLSPAVWVATEWLRRYLFTGFPWVLLGYSQIEVTPIAQVASLFGVYGLSGFITFVSAAVAFAIVTRSPRRWVPLGAAALAIVAAAAWGSARVRDAALVREGQPLRVGVVQGNIPQNQKWDPAHAGRIIGKYVRMTHAVAAGGAQFVVWPESSLPCFFERDIVCGSTVRELARQQRIDLLIGSDQMEDANPPRYYNAAYLVRNDGTTGAVYRKVHLVPFGEYVPLKRFLFFVGNLVEAVSDFSAGDRVVLLPVGDRVATTAICYEVVYPDLIREAVLAGSELLTTITNDAWYGSSSAPYQHFAQAAMRAVEQGRYLVRAANTGISGIVDPYGRALARTPIFEDATVVHDVRLLTRRTLYARIGDLFANACVAVTIAAVAAAWIGGTKRAKEQTRGHSSR
jgi:apolipoprotein N-acyltransferase